MVTQHTKRQKSGMIYERKMLSLWVSPAWWKILGLDCVHKVLKILSGEEDTDGHSLWKEQAEVMNRVKCSEQKDSKPRTWLVSVSKRA